MIPAFAKYRGAVITDPYWSSVASLNHFDGANGASSFTDQKGIAWVNQGAAALTTANYKFGTASMQFTGAATSYVYTTDSSCAIGTQDFTWEGWVNRTASGAISILLDMRPSQTNGAYPVLYHDASGLLHYYVNSNDQIAQASGGIASGTFSHVAISRNSGNTRLFIDGVQHGATYADANNYGFSGYTLGASSYDSTLSNNFVGEIDDARLTVGVGRYTTNFTPPSSPFPNN